MAAIAVADVPIATITQHQFTKDALQALWIMYLQTYKDKGLVNECLILDRPIQLLDYTIVLRLDNVIQEDHLNSFKAELLEYLRRNLKNNLINIQIEIKEDNEIKKLYTSKEKYLFLAEKHPVIDELRLRLGLDLNE